MAPTTAPADPQLRRLLLRAGLYPAFLMIAVAAMLGWQVRVLRDLAAWVDHTDVVLARVNDLARLQLERESALRGYFLARTPSFLQAYEVSDRAVTPAVDVLERLVADNPVQLEGVRRIRQLASEWHDRAVGGLRLGETVAGARDAVQARTRIIDAFRTETLRFAEVEEGLRTERSARVQRASNVVLAATLLLSLVVGAALARMARAQLRNVAEIHARTARAAEERARALELSEGRFRLFVEGVRDSAIYMLDSVGNVVSWNAGAERIKGWAPQEIIGRHFSVFYTPEDLEAGVPERELAQAERGETKGESWRVRKDGSRFWASVTMRALHDADGRLVGYAKLVHDTTERKRAEMRRAAQYGVAEALAAAQTLGDALPKVLAALGAALGYELVLAWAPAGERLELAASWLRPSSRGESFIGFVRAVSFRRGEGLAGGVWASGEPGWVEDIRNALPGAHAPQAMEAGFLSAVAFGVAAGGGETALVVQLLAGDPRPKDPELVGVVRLLALQIGTFVERIRQQGDVREAERRRAEDLERRVSERTVELTAVNRELEAFSYSVSHDLRGPLRALDGFSQVLLEDYAASLDAQGRDYLGRIRAASQRMSRLIDDLIELSRVTRSEIRRDDVDLSALFAEVVEELRERDRGRAVEVALARGIHVRGDERLLHAGLVNLVGNAFKFTRDQAAPRVEFGVSPSKDGRVYHVRDNGAGFDMAYARKLFQPFQRLHSDAEFEGTGIGLATWQRIVHRHGGRVWAEGEPGKGATFFFTLGEF
jgi:PAS domain S-box-containing protein